jgi:hypothetical protein
MNTLTLTATPALQEGHYKEAAQSVMRQWLGWMITNQPEWLCTKIMHKINAVYPNKAAYRHNIMPYLWQDLSVENGTQTNDFEQIGDLKIVSKSTDAEIMIGLRCRKASNYDATKVNHPDLSIRSKSRSSGTSNIETEIHKIIKGRGDLLFAAWANNAQPRWFKRCYIVCLDRLRATGILEQIDLNKFDSQSVGVFTVSQYSNGDNTAGVYIPLGSLIQHTNCVMNWTDTNASTQQQQC